MCIQLLELYSVCRCLYYKHTVDKCPRYGKRGHDIRKKDILVGYTCPEHSSSSVYRPSGTRARLQAPENYQSDTECESRSGSPVSAQSQGSHQPGTDSSDNGPAVVSDKCQASKVADTGAPNRELMLLISHDSGSHHGQSELQTPSTSTASPGQFDTRHAPSPRENMCPHHLMQSLAACPRECGWNVEQTIERGDATTDINRRQLNHLLRDSLVFAFADLSQRIGSMAVTRPSVACMGTNSHTVTDMIELDSLQSDKSREGSTSRAPQPPMANLQETESPFTATAHTRRSEKWPFIPPCYLLIFLGFLTIVGSLVPGLWRASSRNDLSGGFSLAQYILGVGIFVVGSMVAIHSKSCKCWKTQSDGALVVDASH